MSEEHLEMIQVLKADASCPELPIIDGPGIARAIVWPGTGAQHRSMHHISLPAESRTITLRHPMEAVYYVMQGEGAVRDPEEGTEQPLVEGTMVLVEPDTAYLFRAGPGGVEILGGPCPPDPALYRHLDSV